MLSAEPRSLPADVLIAERTVIGTALSLPGIMPGLMKLVRPGLLYGSDRRDLLAAMIALHSRNEPCEAAPVISELRQHGKWTHQASIELADCLAHTCAPTNLPHYCRTVRVEWATRQRIKIAEELGNGAASDPDAANALLEQLGAINATERGPGSPKWAPSVLSGQTFDAIEMTTPPSLLGDGLLCDGELGVLYGSTGLGKSFLGEQLVHAVATGEEWLGLPTVAGGAPVLAIHLELSAPRLRERRQRRWATTPPTLHTLTSGILGAQIDILNDADRSALCEVATSIGARLVYVDPLQELHSAGETNDAFHAVVRAITDCMIRTRAAFLIVHHEPKGLTEKGAERSDIDAMRGGTRLPGAAKLAIRLKKLKAPNRFDLVFSKVTHREEPKPLYLRQVEGGFFDHAERPEEKQDRTTAHIERMLLGAGIGTVTTKASIRDSLADAGLPSSEDSVRRAMDRLAFSWGFQSRQDLQIGKGHGTGYTYRKAEYGSQASGVAESGLLPQDSEEWQ